MFRAGEAQNRVVHRHEEVRMGSFEAASKRSFVQILDDIVPNELPELAWGDPDTTLMAHHLCGMFACAGQTNTSKNFALSGNLHWSNVGLLIKGRRAVYSDFSRLQDHNMILVC